ncbi:MAG: PEP-CTERM sorting domain-containing protein [Armatimonadota bacterium]
MRIILCVILLVLCILQPASAAYPTLTASVNQSSEGIVYTYTLTNTLGGPTVYRFSLCMPASVLPTITSAAGPTGQWAVVKSIWLDEAAFSWQLSYPESGISPGSSGSFTIVTKPGVPTDYNYTSKYLPIGIANWVWTDTDSDDTRQIWAAGNTVLPVPVPEPSSLAALCVGLIPLMLRRRR